MLRTSLSNLGQRGESYPYDALPYFRGNLTPSTLLNYICKLIYIIYIFTFMYGERSKLQEQTGRSPGIEPSKQPGTISKHHNPLKIRGSSALKFRQGKHLLSFVWSCISSMKTQQLLIKELNTFQILAWLRHQFKATRTAIDNIYSYIMRPLTTRISRGQHHSTCQEQISYPCHHELNHQADNNLLSVMGKRSVIRPPAMFFPKTTARKRVYILTLWDKVAPSVV